MKLTVILPAHNEEGTIGAILDAVLGVDFSSLPEPVEMGVVVVDDASSDRTGEIVQARCANYPAVKLIRHEVNRGKGGAIQAGLEYATGDVVLIQDADLEYSVEDYPALLLPFIEQGAEVVYGSRFLLRRWPTGMRLQNYLANRILTFAANLLYLMWITDEATCFKVFRTELIKSFHLRARGFDFCPEVTSLVRLRGVKICEVPVDYTARTNEEGKKIRWTDGPAALWTLLKYRIRGEKGEKP